MEEYALEGCQNNTIATLMNIPTETLVRRFGEKLTKKRAERKYNLRKIQNAWAQKNHGMAIFLGKNELDQADTTQLTGAGGGPIQITIIDFAKIDDTK